MARPGKRSEGGRWLLVFLVAAALALASYGVNAALSQVSPASVWGLTYGALAAVVLLATSLYGLRRRAMRLVSRLGLGRARSWLYFHVYGGALFLLLVLLHSGFRLPNGVVTWWLWALSLWTVASGLVGLALQQWIPKVLGSGLAIEVLYERIPELVEEIRRKAETLAAASTEPVQALYARRVAPALTGPEWRPIYYFDVTGGKQAQLREFDYLRQFLPGEEKEKLTALGRLYKTKLQIDAHYTLQRALRIWLWIHVPPALVLLAFLALHLYSVWSY